MIEPLCPAPPGAAAEKAMTRHLLVLIALAGLAGLSAGSATSPEPAASVATPQAISSDQFESHPAFDPLSGDLYFVRSSPQFEGWRIWRSRCRAGGLAEPEPAPFGAEGVDADPFFTPDGRQLYFISSRADPPAKTGDDLDIWRMERSRSGEWRPPLRLPAPVNSSGAEWFPRLDAHGRLTFGSDRPGGRGQTDIYVARHQGRGWRVENLGGEVSTAGNEYEFEPARSGRFAVLMADGRLFRIDGRNGRWGRRSALPTGRQGFHVGPLLSPTGRTLLFAGASAQRSGELFRLALADRSEDWPPSCPPRSITPLGARR
jgi:hypothetical protein